MVLMAQFHLLTADLPALGINRLSGFEDQNKHLIIGNCPRYQGRECRSLVLVGRPFRDL